MEVDLTNDGAVGLKLRPSVARSFIHFVVSSPAELDRVAITGLADGAGDAAKGEPAASSRDGSQEFGQADEVIGRKRQRKSSIDPVAPPQFQRRSALPGPPSGGTTVGRRRGPPGRDRGLPLVRRA
jgi:hypothetical protein